MSIEQLRAQVIGSIWQAIAQSGVDLSSIPQDQQEKVVSKIADGVMVTMDGILGEDMPMTVTENEVDELGEDVLWKGRPFLSLVENYTITSDRIKVVHGLLGKDIENFELIRIQDLDMNRGITERMLNLGDIIILGQDPSQGRLVLRNIADPEAVYELLRKAWLSA